MRLNDIDKARKITIYESYRGQIKGKSKKEVKTLWKEYRKTIQKEIILPIARNKAKGLSKTQKTIFWEKYRERKATYIKPSETFLTKHNVKKYSTIDTYKTTTYKSAQKNISKWFNSENPPRYVLVILKIRSKEGEVLYVSDSYTDVAYENVIKTDGNIQEAVLKKLSFVHRYDGFKLLGIYIRKIYANTKENNQTQKNV